MAIYVPSHKVCFIHNPKTGGSSIQYWLFENTECVQPKNTLHCNIQTAIEYFPDIELSFAVVRNPWDWCVSWYFYQKKRANDRIQFIKDNPDKLDLRKEKYNLSVQQDTLKYLELGFEHWLENATHSNQFTYTQNVNLILKFENLKNDFQKIQNILNIFKPLPYLNSTPRVNYKTYHNARTIKLVYNKYYNDINTFGYKYETP